MSRENQGGTIKALAVALVAVSKAIAASDPDYGERLVQSLESAEKAGISPDELQFLRLLVTSAAATAEARRNRPA